MGCCRGTVAVVGAEILSCMRALAESTESV